MMTEAELRGCLHALRSYYRGVWDEERLAVWLDALHDLDHATAMHAVRSMGRTERYPSVAALLEHAGVNKRNDGGVTALADGTGYFVPGTGRVEHFGTPRAELEPPAGLTSVKTAISDARARLRGSHD